jgi:hypothetical protein
VALALLDKKKTKGRGMKRDDYAKMSDLAQP